MPRKLEELTGEFDYIANYYPAGSGDDDETPEIKVSPAVLIDGTMVVGRRERRRAASRPDILVSWVLG